MTLHDDVRQHTNFSAEKLFEIASDSEAVEELRVAALEILVELGEYELARHPAVAKVLAKIDAFWHEKLATSAPDVKPVLHTLPE